MDNITSLGEAKDRLRAMEQKLKDAQDRIKVLEGTVYTFESSETFGEFVKEVERLKQRELALIEANNREVEKRRELAAKLRELDNDNPKPED